MRILTILAIVFLNPTSYGEEPLSTRVRVPVTKFIVPNLDDDDRDGVPDAQDGMINGESDRNDLTGIEVAINDVEASPTIEGPGKSIYRIVEVQDLGPQKRKIFLEAKEARSSSSQATLSAFGNTIPLEVSPYLLTSSLDPVEEVFAVEVPKSRPFISELRATLERIAVKPPTVLSVVNGSEYDVWIQDATEIGYFKDTNLVAALHGLRAKHRFRAPGYEPLDKLFAEKFPGPGRCILNVGDPLPERKWIDWFGNLEVTPPITHQVGRSFPHGRILTGKQENLEMHQAVMDFLRAQQLQWPPIVLDTSFLLIGHVDEIVQFVPSEEGFKMLLAWPAAGRTLLEKLQREGHGNSVLLKGKKDEVTVSELLDNEKLMDANDTANRIMFKNRELLKREIGIPEERIVEIPLVFKASGFSVWPNVVNGLVLGKHFITPKPFGPIINDVDMIENACRDVLSPTGIVVHFLDAYDPYSIQGGEIHCGTNAVRLPAIESE